VYSGGGCKAFGLGIQCQGVFQRDVSLRAWHLMPKRVLGWLAHLSVLSEFDGYFYLEYAKDEARVKSRRLTQQIIVMEYVREFSELILQIFDLGEKETFFSFLDGLKSWAKQELQQKDKFESSKPKEKGNYGGDEGHGENRNVNGCNGKPHNRKWKSNNKPKGPMKCFFCEGLHMARDYSK
ncbi:hypothetical protein Gohar_020520, partial [Gossypium harknessii]|nr:hypothetical protein [Gossypium harknessii]